MAYVNDRVCVVLALHGEEEREHSGSRTKTEERAQARVLDWHRSVQSATKDDDGRPPDRRYYAAMFSFFKRKVGKAGKERSHPGDLGVSRKARSIAVLKQRGVPVNDSLPPLGGDADFGVRSAEDVLRRARGRLIFFMRSQFAVDNAPFSEYRKAMNELNAWGDLSPHELKTVEAETLTQRQIVDSSWAIEGVVALAWVIGLEPELGWPSDACDVRRAVTLVRQATSGKVRPLSEILDAADLHYRIHWACRQLVQLEGKAPPHSVLPSVVIERRHALEWVICPEGWDDVDLST